MRNLLAAILFVSCGAPIFAQTGISAELKRGYSTIRTNLLGAANAMPEANYSFAPVPEEMTFGKWIAHVADAQTVVCSAVNGQTVRPDNANKTSKVDLVAALQASFAYCDKAFDALTDANALELVNGGRGQSSRAGALAGVNVHDNECYGSMAVYLRIKGIIPPSTVARGMSGMQGRGR